MQQPKRISHAMIVVLVASCLVAGGLWMGGAFSPETRRAAAAAHDPSTPFPDGLRVEHAAMTDERSWDMLEDERGVVRLHSITIESGMVRIIESATGRSIGQFSGGEWSHDQHRYIGSNQLMLGGLPVRPPLEFVRLGGSRSAPVVHIYFWNH